MDKENVEQLTPGEKRLKDKIAHIIETRSQISGSRLNWIVRKIMSEIRSHNEAGRLRQ